jgi:DNA-binding NarL/FixJ family response regulator
VSTELDETPTTHGYEPASVTVVIAEEEEGRRRMVRELLENAVRIAGEAIDDQAAVGLVQEHRPHVALIGIGLPKLGGLETVRRIKSERPETRVVLLTSHEEAYLSATGKSGADALLPWKDLREQLLATIRALTRSHVALWDGTERRGSWPRSRTAPWDGRERRRNPTRRGGPER